MTEEGYSGVEPIVEFYRSIEPQDSLYILSISVDTLNAAFFFFKS